MIQGWSHFDIFTNLETAFYNTRCTNSHVVVSFDVRILILQLLRWTLSHNYFLHYVLTLIFNSINSPCTSFTEHQPVIGISAFCLQWIALTTYSQKRVRFFFYMTYFLEEIISYILTRSVERRQSHLSLSGDVTERLAVPRFCPSPTPVVFVKKKKKKHGFVHE